MTKAERLQFMRRQFGAKKPFPATPPKPTTQSAQRKKVYMPWPDIIVDHKRTPGWMMQPSEKQQVPLGERRIKRVSPLTRISQQLPKKLLCVLFRP
jgi:hypothetical protein